MLAQLRVKNFALVEDVTIDLKKGFTVFTGETGAGKSLLLDAITLLLGAKAHSSMVRTGAKSAEVEGVFFFSTDPKRKEKLKLQGFEFDEDDGGQLLVRREISSVENSRNRIWIQGKVATRSQLQTCLGDWVEISGQHEFLKLNQDGYILKVVDQYGQLKETVKEYQKYYFQNLELTEQIEHLLFEEKNKASRLDYLEFLLDEFKKAGVDSDFLTIEPTLEATREKLLNSDKIQKFVSQAQEIFCSEGTSESIESLIKKFQKALTSTPLRLETSQRLRELGESLNTQIFEVSQMLNELDKEYLVSDESFESVEDQISKISRLKRKHLTDSAGLVQILKSANDEILFLKESESRLEELTAQRQVIVSQMELLSKKLTENRTKICQKLSSKWQESVRELGLEKAQISLVLQKNETFGPFGVDSVQAFFSANPGQGPHLMSKIASGGELSRLMLGLKSLVANRSEIGVFLFDEIDTGIGGKAAQKVATKLSELSRDNQVLVVSHLASIAAAATEHFLISKQTQKNKTATVIEEVENEKRLEEIARMLGGTDTRAAKDLASELLRSFHLKKIRKVDLGPKEGDANA
jgi:DNA repair protein RecN (Recombination protein N)